MASLQSHNASTRSLSGSPSPFSSPSPPPLQGLASQLKQLHFAPSNKAPTPVFNTLPTGKHSSSSLPPSFSKKNGPSQKDKEHAILAAYASQTLFGKLTGAFWDAFNSTSTSPSGHTGMWDVEKVRKVLEGKAVVKIVDLEPAPKAEASGTDKSPRPTLKPVPAPKEKKCDNCSVTALLEEGISRLSLGKNK